MGADRFMVCWDKPSILFSSIDRNIDKGFGFFEYPTEQIPLDFVNFKSLKKFINNFHEQAGKINFSDIRNS